MCLVTIAIICGTIILVSIIGAITIFHLKYYKWLIENDYEQTTVVGCGDYLWQKKK